MRKRTIAVTGAAGFIGSNLCGQLVKQGYKVIGIDNLSKGSELNLAGINTENFSFYKLDITNLRATKEKLKEAQIIVHLAAAKIPRYGNRISTLLINTKGTENILEVCRAANAKIIFVSTSDVYGKNTKLPFSEESDLVLGSSEVARWSYAASKIFDEHLCYAYWEEYKVPFLILRLFGVYGPNHHRSWWGGPPSVFIDSIINGKDVELHGTGNQTRTFIYIDDAINAMLKTIKSPIENQIINVGGLEEISITDFAKLTAGILKKPLKLKRVKYSDFTGEKYQDVLRRKPDLKKAETLLNWIPKVSLREGMERTINWHLQNPK